MRRGVAQSIARIGKAAWWRCSHDIGNLLARSVLYKTLAILAAAYPTDVILVSHTLSILRVLCIVMLYCLLCSPILLLRNAMSEHNRCLTSNLGTVYSYSIYTILSLPTDVSAFVVLCEFNSIL